jgi:hypothetical protein
MRVLIALLFVFPTLSAQETFTDPDFEFSMSVPSGMVLTTAEEQAAASGQPVENYLNAPRAEHTDGTFRHVYRWRDATERDRNISVYMEDGPFPFSSVDKFKEAINVTMNIVVDGDQMLSPPDFKHGMRVEGTRMRSDGAALRQTDIFLPISGDPSRYVLLRMDCLDGDWSLMWPDFLATLQSVDMPQPTAGSGGSPRGGNRRRRGADAGGSGGPDVVTEDWDTLEVTGSLVLAVLLLMGLFMGGRAATTA